MYTELTQFNSPNYTPASQAVATYGLHRQIEGITIHWWGDPNQNPSFMGTVDYLCRPGGNTSAHVVATGTGRQVAWIVSDGDIAWQAGSAAGNATTIGIECDPRCRPEDYDVVAELIADIWKAHDKKLPLYPHSHWYNTTCPGNYDLERLRKLAEEKFNKGEDMPLTPAQVDHALKMGLRREPKANELNNKAYYDNPGLLIDTIWNNGGRQSYDSIKKDAPTEAQKKLLAAREIVSKLSETLK